MAYAGLAHQTACNLQKQLVLRVKDPGTNGRDIALIARSWIELEILKREMRGIPRLLAVSVRDLAAWRREMKGERTIGPSAAATAIEVETKESLSPDPVTAPPAADAPTAT